MQVTRRWCWLPSVYRRSRRLIVGFLAISFLAAAWTARPILARASAQVTAQVLVTGYVDRGYTASGVYTHPGTCAVDPRVIPLGTYITIQGLWTCHAEDTGSAVIGYHVDLWVATTAEAYAITGYRMATWTVGTQQVLGFQGRNPAVPTPSATSTALYVTWTPGPSATSTPAPATLTPTTVVRAVVATTPPIYETWTPVAHVVRAYPTQTPTVRAIATSTPTARAYATWTPVPEQTPAYATWTPPPSKSSAPKASPSGVCKTIHWTEKVKGITYHYYRTTCH